MTSSLSVYLLIGVAFSSFIITYPQLQENPVNSFPPPSCPSACLYTSPDIPALTQILRPLAPISTHHVTSPRRSVYRPAGRNSHPGVLHTSDRNSYHESLPRISAESAHSVSPSSRQIPAVFLDIASVNTLIVYRRITYHSVALDS